MADLDRDHKLSSNSALRVYTHNILGQQADWENRRSVLTDIAQRFKPDIVMLQEEILTTHYDQTADILGSEFNVVHSRARSQAEGSGIAIASRWPVKVLQEIDLTIGGPTVDEFTWASLIAVVDAPEPLGPILVVNHFPDAVAARENERERQAVVVALAVETHIVSPDQLVILGGDLDADADSASVRFLTGKQSLNGMSVCYRNAWDAVHPGEPGWTFEPRNDLFRNTMANWPFRRIDHLFVRCGSTSMPPVDILDCELVGTEPVEGIWASDHFGLVADLG